MELNEATNRIFRHHFFLIVFFVLLGMAGGLALHLNQHTEYSASARLVLDTPDPQSSSESQAIADTARAIATGPAEVAGALRQIGAHRHVMDVAKHAIAVGALGTSGVLELTVTDTNPRVAAALANALAKRVIQSRVAISTGRVNQITDDLNSQIDDLTRQIVDADSKLDALNSRIAHTTDPAQQQALRSQRDNLAQTRDYLSQRRVVLESERATIATSDALRPQASLLDPAEAPIVAAPNRRIPDLALGGLLGLMLGVGVAASIEALRPSVVGAEAIAKEMGAPVLGELPAPPDQALPEEVAELAPQLGLAASNARIDRIELFGTDPSIDLIMLAMQLRESWRWRQSSPGSVGTVQPQVRARNSRVRRGGTAVAGRRDAGMPSVGVALADTVSPNGFARVGLVLVTPAVVRRADLVTAANFHVLSGWPLVGVVAYRKHRRLLSLGVGGRRRDHEDEPTLDADGELQEELS